MTRTIWMTILTAAFAAASLNAQFVPRGAGYGPRDGSGYQGAGPRDGTGYGAKSGKRQGTCDQTGPKGPRAQGQGQRGRR